MDSMQLVVVESREIDRTEHSPGPTKAVHKCKHDT